jgi:hypothetical protein
MTTLRRKRLKRKGRGPGSNPDKNMLAMVPYSRKSPPRSRKNPPSNTPSSRIVAMPNVYSLKEITALYNACQNKLTTDKMALKIIEDLDKKISILEIDIPQSSRKDTYCSFKNIFLFEIIATSVYKSVFNIPDIIFSRYMSDIKQHIRKKGVHVNELMKGDRSVCIETKIPAVYFNNLLEKLIYYGSYGHISHAIEGDSPQLEHLLRLIDMTYYHGAICNSPQTFINPVVSPACSAIYKRIVTNNNTYTLKQLLEKAIL